MHQDIPTSLLPYVFLVCLHVRQPYRIYTVAVTKGAKAFSLTEAFDGVDKDNATVSIVKDGVPRLHVETLADGQAAWTYDIFFTGPHFANVAELTVVDEGSGECLSRLLVLVLFFAAQSKAM